MGRMFSLSPMCLREGFYHSAISTMGRLTHDDVLQVSNDRIKHRILGARRAVQHVWHNTNRSRLGVSRSFYMCARTCTMNLQHQRFSQDYSQVSV